jgi:hypothetical protein
VAKRLTFLSGSTSTPRTKSLYGECEDRSSRAASQQVRAGAQRWYKT